MHRRSTYSRVFLLIGIVFCVSALFVVFQTLFPLLRNEFQYRAVEVTRAFLSNDSKKTIVPIDTNFGIVIPKLGANARIVANVDPYNAGAYQKALTQGVAHANGTVFPGQVGNIFLFSHSSVDFLTATQYNSVFYLISKLENGDTIQLYYHNELYTYVVRSKNIVEASAISYLTDHTTEKRLTLMTCWPPGTNMKRLIVTAQLP